MIVLDARLRVAPATGAPAAGLAIAPYPEDLVTLERLRDGAVINVRPLRPEDEPLFWTSPRI